MTEIKYNNTNNTNKTNKNTNNGQFKLPISYIKNKQQIDSSLIDDLELQNTSKEPSLYNYVFNSKDRFNKGACDDGDDGGDGQSNSTHAEIKNNMISLWNEYYTVDKKFLKNTQKLLKRIKNENVCASASPPVADPTKTASSSKQNIYEVWNEIKKETGFMEKYHYMDWEKLKELNNNSQFLQLLSMYNMASPILSLILPVFFLIIPFFILKLQGLPLTTAKYMELLKHIFRNHHIGQLFNLSSASADKIMYIVITFVLYVFQIYQNVMSCIKFYKNMTKIHDQLFTMRDYIKDTINNIKKYRIYCDGLKTYDPFIKDMEEHAIVLEYMDEEFSKINLNKLSIKKIFEVGHVMKCFYQLYKNEDYRETIEYSFYFNEYYTNLKGIGENINKKNMSFCKINNKKTTFTNAYFPVFIDANPVKNSYELSKHILITGPNAAGKTTLLKTTLFNIIVSQQFGCGFYDSADIYLYDMIHSYINIPDTSGRDSLFQSEARRCKNILDKVVLGNHKTQTTRHFCIFDELYSGTNPYEAIGSAYSFLKYLNKYDNITFMITTHFLDLCKRLDNEPKINNCNMKINISNHTDDTKNEHDMFQYTYKLEQGISTIKGGVKVLKDLEYPNEIINNTNNIIKELIL